MTEDKPGKHRDPENRRRKPYEPPRPVVYDDEGFPLKRLLQSWDKEGHEQER